VLVFAAVVMVLTTIPYVLGYAVEGIDYRFTGFVFAVEEGNSYIAKMLTGSYGAWLFRSPYTAYPQQGMFIYLPYILLGKLASPPGLHEQLVALFHIFRFISGILAILATYDFLSFFLKNLSSRRIGLALAVIGGGLGWLLVLLGKNIWLGSLPLDFYSPETFGFLGIYGLPHLALGRALILWALLVYLRFSVKIFQGASIEESSILDSRSILALSGLWLLAGLMQPLSMIIIGVVIAMHLIAIRLWYIFQHSKGDHAGLIDWWRVFRMVALAGILPAIFVLYNLYMSFSDPYASTWIKQNLVRSPHPAHYLLAYGLILPYAVLGCWLVARKNPIKGWFLIGWVVIAPLLVYFPINLQRRLPDGVWVALVTLAMITFEEYVNTDNTNRVWKRWIWFTPLCHSFLTSAFLLAGGSLTLLKVTTPLFRPSNEVTAFEWIQSEIEPDSVVLAAYETGNPLPAWAPVRVLIGHGPESSHLNALKLLVESFFSTTTSDQARLELLQKFDVDYVFYGPAEQSLGEWDPNPSSYLRLVYQSGDYSVFQFLP